MPTRGATPPTGAAILPFACSTARDDDPVATGGANAVTGRAYLEPEDVVLHLDTPDDALTARLAVGGLHNARNATAATAACVAAGIELGAIRAGLEAFRPAGGRSRRIVLDDGTVVIDDSYNANPDSMRAAIDLLAGHASPRLLVVGDMGEVGVDGPAFHAEIGAHARDRGIESMYAIGDASGAAAAAFGDAAIHFDDIAPLIDAVLAWTRDHRNGAVAVKGSRFMRMERVVAALSAGRADNERLH